MIPYLQPSETPAEFIVGATYEMLTDDHSYIPRGNTFTVAYIDRDGDARVVGPRGLCVTHHRIHDNEVRLVSLPNQKESTMTTQEA